MSNIHLLLVAFFSIVIYVTIEKHYNKSKVHIEIKNSSLRSYIISDQAQFIELMDLCKFYSKQNFRLLYRGSRDGFNSLDFHANCDGIKNTLTIIKTTEDYIFGGYTGAAWDCSGNYIEDTSTFIFSLKNYKNSPFRAMCVQNRLSIYGSKYYGPVFGMSDLVVKPFSNFDKFSYSQLSRDIFNFPSSQKYILSGEHMFQIKEIEVYEKLDSYTLA